MRFAALFASLLLLASCAGFSPMYAKNSSARTGLSQVQVSKIDGRSGFLLAQQLYDKAGIRQGEAGNYQLSVKLTRARRGFAVRVDEVATRYEVSVTATWVLKDAQGKKLAGMSATGASSYSDTSDPYAGQVAAEAAEDRATSLLADSLIEQLGFYFAANGSGK